MTLLTLTASVAGLIMVLTRAGFKVDHSKGYIRHISVQFAHQGVARYIIIYDKLFD